MSDQTDDEDWVDDEDYDDEGELDVEWFPLPKALQDVDDDEEEEEEALPVQAAARAVPIRHPPVIR